MDEIVGRFLVTHVDSEATILKEVFTSGVYTIQEPTDFEFHQVLDATINPIPPLDVTWTIDSVHSSWTVTVQDLQEPPTLSDDFPIDDMDPGDILQTELADGCERHLIVVPQGETDNAIEEIIEAESTHIQAARVGAPLVEIRSVPGVISVRYIQHNEYTSCRAV